MDISICGQEKKAANRKATALNLTNHSYWNLAGQGTRDIPGHESMLKADGFTTSECTAINGGLYMRA